MDYPITHRKVGHDSRMAESALSFALYGLDRLWTAASWVQPGARPWLNLGPGNKHIEDTHELDWPDWNGESGLIPARTESYGAVFATHFLEHLRDPRPILAEVGRVLKPGCPFNILVPLAGTGMALQDLDHKSVYTLDTWRVLLENPYYNKDNNAEFPFQIGTNFVYGSKMENLALITQLIKFGE